MLKKLIQKLWERFKNIIKGPVAQSDRAIAFKNGACSWNIRKVISKGDYLYALVPEHPNATKNGYVLMHRVVMENHLGRLLSANEVVHHKDHNKKNNSIENLEVMNAQEHSKFHGAEMTRAWVKLKCPQCGKIFERFKNNTHLQKPSKFGCSFCSPECRGKFTRRVQIHGLTAAMKDAISKNVVEEFRK